MLEFRPCPADEPPAAALVQGMRDEIAVLYDGLDLDGPQMPKAGPRELGPPGGTFVVGFEDGGNERGHGYPIRAYAWRHGLVAARHRLPRGEQCARQHTTWTTPGRIVPVDVASEATGARLASVNSITVC